MINFSLLILAHSSICWKREPYAKLSGVAPCIKPRLNYWITGHINLGNRKRFLPPLNPARKRLCHDLVPKSHLKWSCTVWILN